MQNRKKTEKGFYQHLGATVKTLKEIISTNEWHVKHPFAGQSMCRCLCYGRNIDTLGILSLGDVSLSENLSVGGCKSSLQQSKMLLIKTQQLVTNPKKLFFIAEKKLQNGYLEWHRGSFLKWN